LLYAFALSVNVVPIALQGTVSCQEEAAWAGQRRPCSRQSQPYPNHSRAAPLLVAKGAAQDICWPS